MTDRLTKKEWFERGRSFGMKIPEAMKYAEDKYNATEDYLDSDKKIIVCSEVVTVLFVVSMITLAALIFTFGLEVFNS